MRLNSMPFKVAGASRLLGEILGMADVAVEGMVVERRRSVPRTIVALIALWIVVQTIEYFQSLDSEAPSEFAIRVAEVLRFIYWYLLVGLVAYGLIRGSRFVWIVAFVWQAIEAGFGFVNLALGGWSWDALGDFSGYNDGFSGAGSVGFYIGPFPVIVAAISFALLLAPPTRRWLSERQSLGSSRSEV